MRLAVLRAGISVDETGKQHYLDATIAFKRAVLNCIDYLSKFGYTKRQACYAALKEPCVHMQLGRLDESAHRHRLCIMLAAIAPYRNAPSLVSSAHKSCCLLVVQCLPSGASGALLENFT